MLCKIEYKDGTGIIRSWLLVKYQVLNNCFDGINLSMYKGKQEFIYDYTCPGSDLFFDDKKYDIMKKAGYFIGLPGRYQGEGGVEITEKTKEELLLEQKRFKEEEQNLLNKGYKLFLDENTLKALSCNAYHYYNCDDFENGGEWESKVKQRERYLLNIYGLYLVPEKEINNIKNGTLLVSSKDGTETIFDDNKPNFDWQINDGFSIFGIRLMPRYYDDILLEKTE